MSLSQWCHPTISSSVNPLSWAQSFPASGSFPISQLFVSGDQSTETSASLSIIPMNVQGWFPLGLTGRSLCFQGILKSVFSGPQFESINSLVLSLIYGPILTSVGFLDSSSGKESACNAGDLVGFLVLKILCGRDRLSTPVFLGFPCGSTGKESVSNVGDLGSILGLGRSPGEGKDYLLQYSGLENSMDHMDLVTKPPPQPEIFTYP